GSIIITGRPCAVKRSRRAYVSWAGNGGGCLPGYVGCVRAGVEHTDSTCADDDCFYCSSLPRGIMRQRKGAEDPAVDEARCFFFFHGSLVLFCVWDRGVFKGFAAKRGSNKVFAVELGRVEKG